MLQIQHIKKEYRTGTLVQKALDDVSLNLRDNEFVAILGPSGSGKTTLLNCISTLDKVTTGKIYVGDNEITQLKGNKLNKFRREELGFIFQDFNLLDTLPASFENTPLATPNLMAFMSAAVIVPQRPPPTALTLNAILNIMATPSGTFL